MNTHEHPLPSDDQLADLRRRLFEYERDRRRLELPAAVIVVVVGLLVAVVAVTGARPVAGAAGGWVALVGLQLLWARSVRDRTERGTGPRGLAPRLATDDVEIATVIPAPRARLAVTLAFWLLVAVPLFGAAVLAGRAGAGIPLAIAGAWALVPVLLVAAGRITAGGVWLTAVAVVVRDHGLESRIPWEALATVAPSDAGVVVLRAVLPGSIHRRRSGPWAIGARIAGPSIATVDTRWLALDAPTLARVLEHYRRPGAAAELGTAASLATLTALTGT